MTQFFYITAALFAITFTGVGHAAQSGSVPCPEKAQIFWTKFRDAALDYDLDKVKGMTQFPFRVKGELDWIPIEKVSAKRFNKFWPLILAYGGDLPSSTGMFDIVQNNPKLTSGVAICLSGGFLRIEDWEFQIVKGEYKFTGAYLNSIIDRP